MGLSDVSFPDLLPYFLALLGLLLAWEVHSIAVRAGRVKAVDFWNRSGIRMFLRLTPDDASTCAVCREMSGEVLLPTVVASNGFKRSADGCKNPAGCRCQLVGLYGAWPVAQTLRLRMSRGNGRQKLTADQVDKLVTSAKTGVKGATVVDRVSLSFVEALRAETNNAELAIEKYQFVLAQAVELRDLEFVIPTYLRLSDLLERENRRPEALKVVQHFLHTYGEGKKKQRGRPWPTELQLETMSLRKTRLMSVVPG